MLRLSRPQLGKCCLMRDPYLAPENCMKNKEYKIFESFKQNMLYIAIIQGLQLGKPL